MKRSQKKSIETIMEIEDPIDKAVISLDNFIIDSIKRLSVQKLHSIFIIFHHHSPLDRKHQGITLSDSGFPGPLQEKILQPIQETTMEGHRRIEHRCRGQKGFGVHFHNGSSGSHGKAKGSSGIIELGIHSILV